MDRGSSHTAQKRGIVRGGLRQTPATITNVCHSCHHKPNLTRELASGGEGWVGARASGGPRGYHRGQHSLTASGALHGSAPYYDVLAVTNLLRKRVGVTRFS
ncbi:hypothetical protein PYW08_010807 [Mythimna loreyi]|uniref:Uncharacterized protein n=1 Tax=Mythimna loreyi TaxID=667449 RepID=A0ACC2Q4A9_9NEOP|nr:hypothetical protein PYW08_010807 [Mythimna loreyi]